MSSSLPQSQRVYNATSRYCESCYFRIQTGDLVTAVYKTPETIKSTSFTFEPRPYHGQWLGSEDDDERLHFCDYVSCRHLKCEPYGSAVYHHAACYKIRALTSPLDDLLEHSRWGNYPPLNTDTRRISYFKDSLYAILAKNTVSPLPPEILVHIISLVPISTLSLFATEARSHSLSPEWKGYEQLDLSRKVYQQSILLEGMSYIRRLSNSSFPSSILLFTPQPSVDIWRIDIAEDRLGITDIVFVGDSKRGEISGAPKDGVWWRSIRPQNNMIHALTDSRKLQDVRNGSSRHRKPYIYWDRRGASKPLVNLKTFQLPPGQNFPLRMKSLDLEDCVTGITAACSTGKTVLLHAHVPNDSVALYKAVEASYGQPLQWIFFPMQRGEKLTQIQRRKSLLQHMSIIIQTSQQRSCNFGPYIPPDQRGRFKMDIVTYSRNGISMPIYFNEWDCSENKCIEVIGSDIPCETKPGVVSDPEGLAEGPDYGNLTLDWYRSYASLVDIVGIVTCRNTELQHQPFTGMLLIYADGRRECLGTFPMDYQCEHISPKERPQAIYYRMAGGEGFDYNDSVNFGERYKHVDRLQLDKPPNWKATHDGEYPWHRVKLGHGMLVWFCGPPSLGKCSVEIRYAP